MTDRENQNPGYDSPIIVCECGMKILLIPDLGEMARIIEAHVAMHERNEVDSEKTKAENCRIEALLTQKVLASIADI
jgi:hypothetical protein